MDEAFEREMSRHIESYRPGDGEPPDIDIRGYDDPSEGEMTVLTFGFNVTAIEIHINRDWLHFLCAMIDGIESERRVARGMEIVRRLLDQRAGKLED
jgi:hypothetical protein